MPKEFEELAGPRLHASGKQTNDYLTAMAACVMTVQINRMLCLQWLVST